MKNLLTITSIWLAALSCFGQMQDRKNMLSLNVGISNLVRQDLIFSPFIHNDFSPLNIGIDYTRDAMWYQKASLRYGNFNPIITEPYEFTNNGETNSSYPHSFNLIDMDYLFGKKVKELANSSVTVGGLFAMDVHALNYAYGNSSYFGYYSTLGLGIFGRYQYTLTDRSSLAATLQLPLLVWQARSPYLVNDDEYIENQSSHAGFKTFGAFLHDGQLLTVNQSQTFDLGIQYRYNLSEKWNLGAGYLFEFIHAVPPRELLSYRNSLYLTVNYRF